MRPTKEPRAGHHRPGAMTGSDHDDPFDAIPHIVAPPGSIVDLDMRSALEEARARWGSRAIVHEQITMDGEGHREVARLVGRRSHDAHAWSVIGWGPTWREAFGQADVHEGR
jgi:hypothetical protein